MLIWVGIQIDMTNPSVQNEIFHLIPICVFHFPSYSIYTANWKVTNIECVLDHLIEACPNLEAISLAGWKEFTGDHLAKLVEKFQSLQRIDLSSVNVSVSI